ncbi:MAG: hypothetical protein LBI84_10255, partial [Propionibacteriaceae bacterium]|nr:hypothetical protein [Propionibacteriaceae bacterium]
MLRKILAAAFALSLLSTGVMAPTANAETTPRLPPATTRVTVSYGVPASEPWDPADGDTRASAAEQVACVYSGHIMPCQMHDGYFDQTRQCYAKIASSNPWETRDPLATWWAQTGSHTNGVIMECYMPYEGYIKEVFWAPTAPPAEPTAEEYGAAAWAALQDTIQAPEIGVWPWSTDPPMGIVAYWTGFWAVDPGPEFTDEGLNLSAPVAGTTLEMT